MCQECVFMVAYKQIFAVLATFGLTRRKVRIRVRCAPKNCLLRHRGLCLKLLGLEEGADRFGENGILKGKG